MAKFSITLVLDLLRNCKLTASQLVTVLLPFVFCSVVAASIEALSFLLLLKIIVPASAPDNINYYISFINRLVNLEEQQINFNTLLAITIFSFSAAIVLRFLISFAEGLINTSLRIRLQSALFTHLFNSNWEYSKVYEVGSLVGITTTEATIVAKFYTSFLGFLNFLIVALTYLVFALVVDFELTIASIFTALPLIIIYIFCFKHMAVLSKVTAYLRNAFSAEVSQRYSGLLNVILDVDNLPHKKHLWKIQGNLWNAELKISLNQGFINCFSLMVPLLGLFFLFVISSSTENFDLEKYPNLIAVAVLLLKLSGQFSNLISAYGNLNRLSGSLFTVSDMFKLPHKISRKVPSTQILKINCKGISYVFDGGKNIGPFELTIETGKPLRIIGASGSGKTTFCNLIGGLYKTRSGAIDFEDGNGLTYSGEEYYPKISYVSQYPFIFGKTLREAVSYGQTSSEEEIWDALKLTGIDELFSTRDGLDTKMVENALDISGGQRQRLAIARTILCNTDIYIFDEVLTGLDAEIKKSIVGIINEIAKRHIVIFISHDETKLENEQLFHM